MIDDLAQVKLFMRFLEQSIGNTENTSELFAVEQLALEIMFKARQKRHNIEINQERERDE